MLPAIIKHARFGGLFLLKRESEMEGFEKVLENGITIGGITYRVQIVEQTPSDEIGSVDYTRNLIILERCDLQRMWETLLHEITHIILYHAGYIEHDEKLVGTVSHGLMAMLMQNKEVFRKLCE